LNYENKISTTSVGTVLPDNTVVQAQKGFLEYAFNSSDENKNNLQSAILNAFANSPIDTRRDMSGNIVVSGGYSLISEFPNNLKLSIQDSLKYCKISAPPERLHSCWIGGSIVASLSSTRWLEKKEYEEYGEAAIRRMCWTDTEAAAEYMTKFDEEVSFCR